MASSLPALLVLDAAGQAAPRNGSSSGGNTPAASQAAPTTGSLQLKVRRLSDSVELVIEGAGMAPQLRQSGGASGWQGDLTLAAPSGLRVGPQRLSIPELGFQTITFDGSGSSYRIGINPVSGAPLGRPVVSADGQNLILSFPAAAQVSLPVARFNATQPGSIPQPSYAPPLQPRAVAPPVGDMAVGSMTLRNPGFVNVSGPPITMTMKNAPAKDVLMALAQAGGYGFAYVDDLETSDKQDGESPQPNLANPNRLVSISFKSETYSRALNTALMAAGLQGRKEGNMIFAGPNVLGKILGAQFSKVYRLNQVNPISAADYLASLGAQVSRIYTKTSETSTGTPQAAAITGASSAVTTETSTEKKVQEYGSGAGPLVGLRAATDVRLSTITLVGDPVVVSVAEQYLRQLDLRQRQVALSVKILDVNLSNDSEIDNSFAFRFGNNFIVNDSGRLIGAFGRNLPANSDDFSDANTSQRFTSDSDSSTKLEVQGTLTDTQRNLLTSELKRYGVDTTTITTNTNALGVTTTTVGITSVQSVATGGGGASSSVERGNGTYSLSDVQNVIKTVTGQTANTSNTSKYSGRVRLNPGANYSDQQFFDFVQAQIISSNTKILASPTLILQEGAEPYGDAGSDGVRTSTDGKIARSRSNEAFVRVGTQFVTAYDVKQDINGNNFCQPVFGNAGLTFGAKVDKIDDNGFVTFGLSPEISAPVGTQSIGNCGEITLINDRLLDTGKVRVRDGQTLILTGVISESDQTTVSKWPMLGDMPLVGQFFRRSSGERRKNELVIMVTPRIIQDEDGGAYGYGYQPSTRSAQEFVNR